MVSSLTFLALFGSLLPLSAVAANSANWEGPHIDAAPDNTAVDWWYTQIVGQTPAVNGIPPSIEVVFKHGNTFQFNPAVGNNPLYTVDINGFDLDGIPFANSATFNTSSVYATPSGTTVGIWGNNETSFIASRDHKTFTITLKTAWASGTIVLNSESAPRTGCGSTNLNASPFFDKLVADGRALTPSENVLFRGAGWRISIPGGASTVDLVLGGKAVKFTGKGYKDSNWLPVALNAFVKSWYVLIAQVGPWSFTTFSGIPTEGNNWINSGHLSYKGDFVTSQCNVIGERKTDISVITPIGEATDSGVITPLGFNLTFVLSNGRNVSFTATNIQSNPTVSVYHRWVAKYTVDADGEHHESYGIAEWMNPAILSHWPYIQ